MVPLNCSSVYSAELITKERDAMYSGISGYAVISIIIYLVIILFLLWLAFRFVRAHESIAESLKQLEKTIRRDRPEL